MYERILVPLDGSELAEQALPYAEGIARRLNSEVILLSACAPGDCLERPLKAYLEKRAEELQSLRIKASPLVIQGDAATGILDFVEKNDIGLIVISTYGCTGPGVWAMGGTASKVLQKSHTPTLLIRSRQLETAVVEKELRKILVLLDGSHFAEHVIPYVKGMAEKMDSEVILLRVIEPIRLPHIGIHESEHHLRKCESDLTTKAEREVKLYLNRKKTALKNKGVKVSSVLLQGKPAEAILQYAEDNHVSMIALATHGFSGVTKWAYGSVAYSFS